MTAFSSIGIVWTAVFVGLLSAEPEFTVSGHVGSTVILPCELSSAETETLYIRWSIESETVFERLGEETYQGEGYEGRVDVPEDQLRKRNCSLELKNLTLGDSDVYKSYQVVRRAKRSVSRQLISRVNLSVDVPPLPSKETNGKKFPKGDAAVTCPHPHIVVLSLLTLALLM